MKSIRKVGWCRVPFKTGHLWPVSLSSLFFYLVAKLWRLFFTLHFLLGALFQQAQTLSIIQHLSFFSVSMMLSLRIGNHSQELGRDGGWWWMCLWRWASFLLFFFYGTLTLLCFWCMGTYMEGRKKGRIPTGVCFWWNWTLNAVSQPSCFQRWSCDVSWNMSVVRRNL